MLVNFLFADGNPAFSFAMGALPRIGEEIYWSFTPHDAPKWNDETLADGRSMHMQRFVVRRIEHQLRTMSVRSNRHCVFVYIEHKADPKEAPETP